MTEFISNNPLLVISLVALLLNRIAKFIKDLLYAKSFVENKDDVIGQAYKLLASPTLKGQISMQLSYAKNNPLIAIIALITFLLACVFLGYGVVWAYISYTWWAAALYFVLGLSIIKPKKK